MEEKLKEYFGDMLVFKSPDQSKFFSALSLPSFLRDWLVMRFADQNGCVEKDEVSQFVKINIPRKEQWEQLKHSMTHEGQNVRFLAKIRVEIDVSTREAYFSLPDFGFPQRKKEAVIENDVLYKFKEYLLTPNETWGIIELACFSIDDSRSRIHLVDFKPFRPYQVELEYFQEVRKNFTIKEWLNIVLAAIDYNSAGFLNNSEKVTMLSRLLPFVEKRVNLIELAPKGTGKSYLFSQISKYGWLVSGGSITRARLFYDISRSTNGLVTHYDYVALDEIQSISFPNQEEVQGALKGYLESGEFRVGDYRGIGEAGFVLLGNIDESLMDIEVNMFRHLPKIFHESALLDRFHGFIRGWDIPRMRENLKAHGWALNVEYFSEIMHLLRDEISYRSVVDEVLQVPKAADTRDTEAIKRLCTGFLKLFFPHVTDINELNPEEFVNYCLNPAISMRAAIKKQLNIIDIEFRGKNVPDITCKLLNG